jgi:hypothetical protein
MAVLPDDQPSSWLAGAGKPSISAGNPPRRHAGNRLRRSPAWISHRPAILDATLSCNPWDTRRLTGLARKCHLRGEIRREATCYGRSCPETGACLSSTPVGKNPLQAHGPMCSPARRETGLRSSLHPGSLKFPAAPHGLLQCEHKSPTPTPNQPDPLPDADARVALLPGYGPPGRFPYRYPSPAPRPRRRCAALGHESPDKLRNGHRRPRSGSNFATPRASVPRQHRRQSHHTQ